MCDHLKQKIGLPNSSPAPQTEPCFATLLKKKAHFIGVPSRELKKKYGLIKTLKYNTTSSGANKTIQNSNQEDQVQGHAGDGRPTHTSIEQNPIKNNEPYHEKQLSANISLLGPKQQKEEASVLRKEVQSRKKYKQGQFRKKECEKGKQCNLINFSLDDQKGFIFKLNTIHTEGNQSHNKARSQSSRNENSIPIKKVNSKSAHSLKKPSTSFAKIRKIKEVKQQILVKKWLQIEIEGNQDVIAEKIEKKFGVDGLKASDLIEGFHIKWIIQKGGNKENLDKISRVLDYIENTIRKKRNNISHQNNLKINTVTQVCRDQQTALDHKILVNKEVEDRRKCYLYAHNTTQTQKSAPRSAKPGFHEQKLKVRSVRSVQVNLEAFQHAKQEYRYYLHYRPPPKSPIKAQSIINEASTLQQLHAYQHQRLHSTNGFMYKSRYHKKSQENTQLENEDVIVLQDGPFSPDFHLQYNRDEKQKLRRNFASHSFNGKFANLEDEAVNGLSLTIENDAFTQFKYLQRRKIQDLYKNLSQEKHNPIRRKKKLNHNQNISKVSEKQVKLRPQDNFLRKRHGRYAQIIEKINLARIHISPKQSPDSRTIAEESSPGETLRQREPTNEQENKEQIIPQVNEIAIERDIESLRTQTQINQENNKMSDQELQKLIKTNKKLMKEGQNYQGDAVVIKKFQNKLKLTRSGVKAMRKSSYLRANSFSKGLTKDLQQLSSKNLGKPEKRFTNSSINSSLIEKKMSSLFSQENFPSSPSIIKKITSKKNRGFVSRQSQQQLQLREKQEHLMSEFYEKHCTQKQIDLPLCQNEEMTEEEYRIDCQLQKEKQKQLRERLNQLKREFKKMLEYKIDMEGPSVFCKFVPDRNSKIGCNGLNQFDEIHMLKKPKYISTNYSTRIKNGQNLHSFSQDSFEIDFIKRFTWAAGLLAQKSMENN